MCNAIHLERHSTSDKFRTTDGRLGVSGSVGTLQTRYIVSGNGQLKEQSGFFVSKCLTVSSALALPREGIWRFAWAPNITVKRLCLPYVN